MHFATLVVRNLSRRRTRSALTALGLAIGVAAVVALTAVAWGFERSFLRIYESKGIDLVVVRAGVADRLSSSLAEGLAGRLRAVEGVGEVAASLTEAYRFDESGLVSVVSGWEPGSLLFRGLEVLEGRAIRPGEGRVAMLGRVLALGLEKHAGDALEIAGERFEVVGVYESTSPFESGGLVIPLGELQRMMGREGQVTGFVVVAGPEAARDVAALARRIEGELTGVAAVPARDFVERDLMIRLAKAMAWATSAIALVLGSVGVLNTMVMSVFERTAEIGILRALGWKRRRVLMLVMGEALGLGLVGAVLGVAIGYVGLRTLRLAPAARGFIAGDLPPSVLALGVGLGLALSLAGGIYPALRAARMDPTEALRHE